MSISYVSIERVRIVVITSCPLPAIMLCANSLPGSSNHQGGCMDSKESQRLEQRARIFSRSLWMSGRAGILREDKKRAKPHMSYGAQYRNDDQKRMIFPLRSHAVRLTGLSSSAIVRFRCPYSNLTVASNSSDTPGSWLTRLRQPPSRRIKGRDAGLVDDHQPDD